MMYDLNVAKVVSSVQEKQAQCVLLQFPEGLKPHAERVIHAIESHTQAHVCVWFGDCFGACDIPYEVEKCGIDLIIQFGHAPFHKVVW